MTTMLLLITALVIVLIGIAKAVSFCWGSPVFWILATIATLVFLPFTAGMSPVALSLLIVLRLALVGKMLNTPSRR